jgi:hypothetical protein
MFERGLISSFLRDVWWVRQDAWQVLKGEEFETWSPYLTAAPAVFVKVG